MLSRKRLPKLNQVKLEHYVVFSLIMVVIYTIVVTILTATTESDYSQLYTVFCGIFGGEILASALIKIFKLRNDNTDDYRNDCN